MTRKHNMSHNACYDCYDYSTLRWKVQPSDIVAFVRDNSSDDYSLGEIILLTRDLMHIRRLKDGRIFVISLYDLSDWSVTRVDSVRRLPNGIFYVGDRVCLDGELNLPDEEYFIDKFDNCRVKIHYFTNGRSVGSFFVREGEVLKYRELI